MRQVDYDHRRNGTGNVFTTVEPPAGWRHANGDRGDFAHQMRWLVDEAYPEARLIQVGLDNLNIHRITSLYAAFFAPETCRIDHLSQLRSTVVVTQLPVEDWHAALTAGDPTVGDSILDRLVHNAHRLSLRGR